MKNLSAKSMVLIGSLTISFFAQAEGCSTIDLRNKALGKVRDQGGIGWCFAHAAADVISYKMGKKISVSELGTTYFKLRGGDYSKGFEEEGFKEAGWVYQALKTAVKNGVCLEKDMPSEDFRIVSQNNSYASRILPTIADAMEELIRIKKLSAADRSYVQLPNVEQKKIMGIVHDLPALEAWEKLVQSSCANKKINISGYNINRPLLTRISRKRSFKIIDRQLEKRNVIGLSYYADFLKNINAKRKGSHASVIVGRRWNEVKQSCEYLIRNSHGDRCFKYDPSLSCEQGNIWVPKDLLKKNIQYVDYLEG